MFPDSLSVYDVKWRQHAQLVTNTARLQPEFLDTKHLSAPSRGKLVLQVMESLARRKASLTAEPYPSGLQQDTLDLA